jgi:hypothetical protein
MTTQILNSLFKKSLSLALHPNPCADHVVILQTMKAAPERH